MDPTQIAFRYPLKVPHCTCVSCMRTGASAEKLRILDNIPSPFQKYKLVKVETYAALMTSMSGTIVSDNMNNNSVNVTTAIDTATTNVSVDDAVSAAATSTDTMTTSPMGTTENVNNITDSMTVNEHINMQQENENMNNTTMNDENNDQNVSSDTNTHNPTNTEEMAHGNKINETSDPHTQEEVITLPPPPSATTTSKSSRSSSSRSRDRKSTSHPHPPAQRVIKYDRDLTDDDYLQYAQQYPGQELWKDLPQDQTWCKSILKIIRSLMKSKSASPFLAPVDWVAFNIPDYPTIIKHPMDLKTIENNLVNGVYHDPEQCISDVRLVFSNAFIYNSAEHYVTRCAKELSIKFETALYQL
jgi:hypothetical protein